MYFLFKIFSHQTSKLYMNANIMKAQIFKPLLFYGEVM